MKNDCFTITLSIFVFFHLFYPTLCLESSLSGAGNYNFVKYVAGIQHRTALNPDEVMH